MNPDNIRRFCIQPVGDFIVPIHIKDESGTYLVTSIARDTFKGCKELRTLTIPQEIKTVGSGAFADCPNLTKVTMPEHLSFICDWAFYNSLRIKEVYFV